MSNKDKYGEVLTPYWFIQNMIDDCKMLMGDNFFTQFKNIFEPGAGQGAFFDVLQNENNVFDNPNYHYYFNEINQEHYEKICNVSENHKDNVSYLMTDFFKLDLKDHSNKYDLIIGNLPFNVFSKKFVPGLSKNNKDNKEVTQSKSQTLWTQITQYCFDYLLKENGYYYCVIPCMWLKPDKAKIYDLFTKEYTICLLKTFNCKEANKIFNYQCQTPICYVLVQKKKQIKNDNQLSFKLFSKRQDKYIDYTLFDNLCIPTNNQGVVSKSINYIRETQSTNLFSICKKVSIIKKELEHNAKKFYNKGLLEKHTQTISNDDDTSNEEYKIITGALMTKEGVLSLNGFVTTQPSLYYGVPKLILPHKRLARYFKDYDGEYSCYGRDMFVFLCENKEQIDELYDFLSKPIMQEFVENSFTVRMNFIEKYIFECIPNIFDENVNSSEYLEILI